MKKTNDAGLTDRDLAVERRAEIDGLSRRIRQTLEDMIAAMDQPDGPSTKAVLDKLNQLHAAHLRALTAEDAFHAKFGDDGDAGAIDFEAIRIEIGRQLDRLRESLLAERLSEISDAGTTSDLAVPVRLLGDATPDRPKR